jgi:hypothetical protein
LGGGCGIAEGLEDVYVGTNRGGVGAEEEDGDLKEFG